MQKTSISPPKMGFLFENFGFRTKKRFFIENSASVRKNVVSSVKLEFPIKNSDFKSKKRFHTFLHYIIHSNHLHWNISGYRYWKWFLIRIRSGQEIIEIIRLSRTKPELAELKLDYLGLANIIRRTFEHFLFKELFRSCAYAY